jgi:hypothetical protein
MSASPPDLPHILTRPPQPFDPKVLDGLRSPEVSKVATFWVGRGSGLSKNERVGAVLKAMKDDAAAERAARSLGRVDRETLAAYRRYGGTVNGTVIRLDLQARGVLEVVEHVSTYYRSSHWRHNPLAGLAERLALVRNRRSSYWSPGYSSETEKPFPLYSLHPALLRHIEPAGPAPWSVPALKAAPQPEPVRLPAEVALDLARVFAYVTTRGQVRLNKSGELGTPALRSLAKAVPLAEEPGYPLPEVQALYFEVLRETRLILVDDTDAYADPDAATRLSTLATAQQMHAWARAWLHARYWGDGTGIGSSEGYSYSHDEEGDRAAARQVLAWALSGLAHAEDEWFGLSDFLTELYALARDRSYGGVGAGAGSWDPGLVEERGWHKLPPGEERERLGWLDRSGRWYANALMVTLGHLGLVQRGRSQPGARTADCFRLTPWGQAVFGAPEVEPPDEEAEAKFLVVQPNFDVVAYLDRVSAAGAGTLGRLAEAEATASGRVRTFHVSQASVYQATESGMTPTEVTEFLRRHSQNDLPANVVRSLSDWFARRESLIVRAGLTVLAFPSPAARDDYLSRHKGSACGERFALVAAPDARVALANALVSNHRERLRQTLVADEHGRLRATGPADLVQEARLRRLAERTSDGWRLTGASIRRALDQGCRPGLLSAWLEDHLAGPLPPLLERALDAWMGKASPLELGELTLLHVGDLRDFHALAGSERLRPFLQGSVGPGWLVVPRQAVKELSGVLKELGFTVARELTPGPLPTEESELLTEVTPGGRRKRSRD